eukprot:289706-Pyramimonas_sp.AAC.1
MKPTSTQCTTPKGPMDLLRRSKQAATDRLGDSKKPLTVRTARKSPGSGTGWSRRGWISANRSVQSSSQIYPA